MEPTIKSEKAKVRFQLLDELFTKPSNQLDKLIQAAVINLAKEVVGDLFHPGTVYNAIYRGNQYPSITGEPSWVGDNIDVTPAFTEQFDKLLKMQDTLVHQHVVVDNYITEILNHSETQADLFLLMPPPVHHFLIPAEFPGTSEEAEEYKPIADAAIGYGMLKKRMLANLLIKNL